jgi:GTP-binding protein HflX
VLTVIVQLCKADPDHKRPPILEAWNKIDRLDPASREARVGRARALEEGDLPPVAISATTGEGIDALLAAIDRAAFSVTRVVTLELDAADGRTRARIAAAGRILEERFNEEGKVTVIAELSVEDAARLAPPAAPLPETLRPAAE